MAAMARRVVFFTGAGISKESGIPTYRGAGGTWGEYDYRAVACQRAFERDPEGVWTFHRARRAMVAACPPNAAHHAIARFARAHPTVVITQNIDGLHEAAGTPDAIELHGSLWRLRCEACGQARANRDVPLADTRCDCDCGDPTPRHWRPDITWFEDPMDMTRLARAQQAADDADVLVSVGTSGAVYPAAEIPVRAKQRGAYLVEINPETTPISTICDEVLRGPATRSVPEWIARFETIG